MHYVRDEIIAFRKRLKIILQKMKHEYGKEWVLLSIQEQKENIYQKLQLEEQPRPIYNTTEEYRLVFPVFGSTLFTNEGFNDVPEEERYNDIDATEYEIVRLLEQDSWSALTLLEKINKLKNDFDILRDQCIYKETLESPASMYGGPSIVDEPNEIEIHLIGRLNRIEESLQIQNDVSNEMSIISTQHVTCRKFERPMDAVLLFSRDGHIEIRCLMFANCQNNCGYLRY